MKRNLILLYLLSMFFSCSAKEGIYPYFINQLKEKVKVDVTCFDTVTRQNITFVYPKIQQPMFDILLKVDIEHDMHDSNYELSVITYSLKQVSADFVSVLKSVYIANDGSAAGYSQWDEGLILLRKDSDIYKIDLVFDQQTIDNAIEDAVRNQKIEEQCLKEDVAAIEYMSYYFEDGKLFIHNPVSYPTCWFDASLMFDSGNVIFIPIATSEK